MIHHLFPGNFFIHLGNIVHHHSRERGEEQVIKWSRVQFICMKSRKQKISFCQDILSAELNTMMMWNWEINFPCREIKRFGSAKSNENALLRLAFFTSNYFPSCTFAVRSMPCSSLSMADDLIVSKHDRSLHSPFLHAPLKRQTLASFATQLTHHSWLSTALNFELHHPPSERETTLEKKKKKLIWLAW